MRGRSCAGPHVMEYSPVKACRPVAFKPIYGAVCLLFNPLVVSRKQVARKISVSGGIDPVSEIIIGHFVLYIPHAKAWANLALRP